MSIEIELLKYFLVIIGGGIIGGIFATAIGWYLYEHGY